MSEGSDEVQPEEGLDTGLADDGMKALLDSVLHRLLPAAIDRMLPAGSAGEQQLSADACQASIVLPTPLVAPRSMAGLIRATLHVVCRCNWSQTARRLP